MSDENRTDLLRMLGAGLSRSDHHLAGEETSHSPDTEEAAPRSASSTALPDPPQCSRRGCRAAGSTALEWNNPKIHTPDRRKTWLACPEHLPFLADFLAARGFLRDQRRL